MRRSCLTLAAIAISLVGPTAELQPEQQSEPSGAWVTATPESEGLDSGILADMLQFVREERFPVHSILIVRRGRLVLDAYFYPYDPQHPHDIASATKSVTSLLIGLAQDRKLLSSVHQPVAELLPGLMPATRSARRERLTVEHLLTMQSGFDCGLNEGEPELAAMRRSHDWAAFALALSMRAEPGMLYGYCSCNNHLLSAILSARTGQNALALARQYLFEPLGIRDVIWPEDQHGRSHGWGDLHLYPRDLAKIAHLYLRGGRWNGSQIVSEAWIRQSVLPRVAVREGVAYGYSWWINTARAPAIFEAVGRGGQRAAVLPDKDLVIVFTGGGADTDALAPFLFRAIRADKPLPEGGPGPQRLLRELRLAREAPPARPVGRLPPQALNLPADGYDFPDNPLKLEHLTLKFSRNAAQAEARLRMLDDEWTLPIGLDGRYRFSSSGPATLPVAAMGRWVAPDEFLLDVNTVAKINRFSFRMKFLGDQLSLRIDEATGEIKDLLLSGRAARQRLNRPLRLRPSAGNAGGIVNSWAAVGGMLGRGPSPPPRPILPRSRHLPLASTDGSSTRNLNKIGVRLWTALPDPHSEAPSRSAEARNDGAVLDRRSKDDARAAPVLYGVGTHT